MITWKDPTMLLVTSTLFVPAFQLEIERGFWPLSSLLFLSVMIFSNGLASFICLYVGCRRFYAFAVSSVWHPTTYRILVSSIRLSGRPGGALNGSDPSSSVSSDSHDSVGVRHGFVSLGTVLRAGSVRVSHRNISSSSPSRAPSPSSTMVLSMTLSTSSLSTIATCRTMPELSLHLCVHEKIRAMKGGDRKNPLLQHYVRPSKIQRIKKRLGGPNTSIGNSLHAWDVRHRAKSKLAPKRGAPLP